MNSADIHFSGGPLDGRTLPVLLGLTGQPPRSYEIPVPADDGGPDTVHHYRREPAASAGRFRLTRGWVYVYDPAGKGRRTLTPPWRTGGRKVG